MEVLRKAMKKRWALDEIFDTYSQGMDKAEIPDSPFPALGCRGTGHYLALFPHAYSVPGDGASHFL